jgi:hypothetical protein
MLKWFTERPTEDGVYLFSVVDPNGIFRSGTGLVVLLGEKAYPQSTVPVEAWDREVWLGIAAGHEYYAKVGDETDALKIMEFARI